MEALLTAYWVCFGAGLVYVLLAGTLGAVSHGVHSFGGHDAAGGGEADGADAGGDSGLEAGGDSGADGGGPTELASSDLDSGDTSGSVAHGAGGHGGSHGVALQDDDGGLAHYNPLSPLSVMGFLCAFGAAGLIGTNYVASPWLSLLIAAGGGLVMGLLLWLLIGKLLYSMQGSSEAHAADMLGLEAEVITPVEGTMSGEIAYILEGTRYTSPARLTSEGRVERHQTVRIRCVQDNIAYVEPRGKLLE
jgi:hypothetical protein